MQPNTVYSQYLAQYGVLLHALKELPFQNYYDDNAFSQNDEEAMCAFLTYFFMAGYQYRQAYAVIQKVVSIIIVVILQ